MNLAEIREKLGYQPVLLGVIALVASAVLASADHSTRAPIAAAEARDLQNSLAQVLPAQFMDNDLLNDVLALQRDDGSTVKIYRARKAGQVVGAVFQVAERGYAAEIQLLMAVDRDGKVLGVRVLKHSETPGLGDKIEIAKGQWIDSFRDKSLSNPEPARWGVKKDGGVFDQFAGATITPRAVVKAVKGGLDFFTAHRQAIVEG